MGEKIYSSQGEEGSEENVLSGIQNQNKDKNNKIMYTNK